ncbi:hypothetical protein Leryth_011696 [Lithospermum erythrorhizon]|uniref:Uncharacterized protein n=1 Tax=Lithospermum erythrorhizon TaxID=34254 RepID=A0AAV3RF15_LITER|nr:hypothetical protein Leryth_011696 [Lithospermum erythrorhizon]
MSRVCVSNCMSDTRNPMMRSNYVKVHKWPESDAEFAKAEDIPNMQTPLGESGQLLEAQPRMVDNVSCRQIYLRSYQFSKKETMPERTKKCLGKFRQRMVHEKKKTGDKIRSCKGKDKVKMKKSVPAFRAMFQKMLSCTTSIDVMG